MLPKAGIDTASSGSVRCVPEITICATFVAVGSLTARTPAIVAKGVTALTPVQLWQLAQASAKIFLPSASPATAPSLGEAGAGGASVAGRSGEAIGGTLRRKATSAWISSSVI